MLSSILFTLRMTAFASVVLSSPSPAHLSPRGILSPTCTEIVIPVTVSASTTGEDVSGTYNIAARYCEPTIKIPGKAKTLQFLVHGATYNRDCKSRSHSVLMFAVVLTDFDRLVWRWCSW